MNTNVSYELCVTMICQGGFISCNKLTTSDGAADNEEEWRGVVREYQGALYTSTPLAVTLKAKPSNSSTG